MERIELSTTTCSLSDVARQVCRAHVPLELTEGEIPVARIVPVDRPRSMEELDRALREIPPLGDDSETFAQDVLSIRETLGELDDPWAS